MSFINGLKKIFESTVYKFIFSLFFASMILILVGLFLKANVPLIFFVFGLSGVIVGYSLILFVISFFIATDKLKLLYLLILLGLSIPFVIVYFFRIRDVYPFFVFVNQIITGFFAFKFCIDYAQKFDDFLYSHPDNRKITRLIEFFLFGAVDLFLLWLAWFFLFSVNPQSAIIFFYLLIVNAALIIFVLLRLLFIKKFSAYITVFFVLNLAYVAYIVISIIIENISPGGFNVLISIIVDLFLFIYIIGSIFDRVDYIKEKLKIVGADTIALFIISTKLIVQVINIADALPWINTKPTVGQDMLLLIIFIIFTLLFGLIAIITHKPGTFEEEE